MWWYHLFPPPKRAYDAAQASQRRSQQVLLLVNSFAPSYVTFDDGRPRRRDAPRAKTLRRGPEQPLRRRA